MTGALRPTAQARALGDFVSAMRTLRRVAPAAPPRRHAVSAIRGALVAALAGFAVFPASAQEGGAIRTGEHDGFTRVVMVIEPTTEWSLETSTGAATLFFPGRKVEFGTSGVFDRIPRTRVTAISSRVTARGTEVAVTVNCDCRITASFVGARHLALDVGDRDASPAPTVVAEAPAAAAEVAPAAAPEATDLAPSEAPPPEAAAEQTAREEAAVATAESVLLAQLSRAADQGLIQLAPEQTVPEASATPHPPGVVETIEGAEGGSAAEPEPDTPAGDATPEAEAVPDTLAELLAHDQIEATTVFDRDNASLAAKRAAERAKEPSSCVPDEALDVGRWTNGLPLHAQTPQLMRGVVGEFDRPDPRALRDLSRLYIRFGFGAEADSLIADFDADFPDRALLADLARTVEGRPVAPDGPLALDVACPGRHGLWLALGGAAPAFTDAGHFEGVQTAFADLPTDMRAHLGPTLIARLVAAGRPEEARLIETLVTRPGVAPTVEMRLAEAQLLAAEGKTLDAVTTLRALAESNAHNAVDALIAMTRIALDDGLALPDRTLVDLRGAALQQRGDPREAELRSLLVEALAARGALGLSIAEVRAAQADLPESRERFAELGRAMLGAADPEVVGAGDYADTILNSADLIPPTPGADGARAAISARLIDVGLANAALAMLAPPLTRADAASRLLAARAHLALGDAAAALGALDGLDGFEALTLRAAALARSGSPEAAVALLDGAGAAAQAQPYAWPSGDWDRVRAGDADPGRVAMAGFMAAQSAETPDPAAPVDPAAPTSETAFQTPLPPLDAPSLGAARSMLATAAEVGGFLGGLLQGDGAPAP